jgi:NAD(P)-dependent dehydrogenase (short-subunit alcohol dehydrogenase family)
VAVVTGASRGLGRGIAIALGQAGFTVFCTGRSDKAPTGAWSGTVRDTAAEIDRVGGQGIAVVCDHGDDEQTKAVFDRVERECGRLDILVNNAFAMPDWAAVDSPFWERPLSLWRDMIDIGLRSSYAASSFAAPLMIRRGSGVIAMTSGPGAKVYRHSLPYGVGKVGNDKLAHDMAHDLRPHGVAALSIWPGLIGTERTLHNMAADATGGGGTAAHIETPFFIGRILAQLHAAGDAMSLSGGTFYSTELAARYGVADADGRQPASRRPMFGAPLFAPIIHGNET